MRQRCVCESVNNIKTDFHHIIWFIVAKDPKGRQVNTILSLFSLSHSIVSIFFVHTSFLHHICITSQKTKIKMGTSASNMKRSDSTAFGRLRIDSPRIVSPGPGSVRTSLQRRRQLRVLEHGSADNIVLMPQPTENSRLLNTVGMSPGGAEAIDALATTGSPPLQEWIMPALCCALAYALYNIFIKKGSSHVNPVLGGVILQVVAAVLGCCLLTYLIYTQGGSEVIVYDGDGIYWAILAGVAVGAGT